MRQRNKFIIKLVIFVSLVNLNARLDKSAKWKKKEVREKHF